MLCSHYLLKDPLRTNLLVRTKTLFFSHILFLSSNLNQVLALANTAVHRTTWLLQPTSDPGSGLLFVDSLHRRPPADKIYKLEASIGKDIFRASFSCVIRGRREKGNVTFKNISFPLALMEIQLLFFLFKPARWGQRDCGATFSKLYL